MPRNRMSRVKAGLTTRQITDAFHQAHSLPKEEEKGSKTETYGMQN